MRREIGAVGVVRAGERALRGAWLPKPQCDIRPANEIYVDTIS
jgi:hypothetical protein